MDEQALQVLFVWAALLCRHVLLGFLCDLGGEGSHQPVEWSVV